MDELYLKKKKNYFQIIILIYATLHDVFFFILFVTINIICVSIFSIVCLNKKFILINKFSKNNQVNILFFEIKYFDLYIFLDFSSIIFRYR